MATVHKAKGKGLKFKRNFTKEGVSPFDMYDYDIRSSVIWRCGI
jgi:ribonucleoside-diphosphate reductase alpha chain